MLRLYEREGLIRPPQRSGAGYRHYADDTVDRVHAIRLLKDLGLTLREIALLLSESDADTLDTAHVQALAAAQLQQIDERFDDGDLSTGMFRTTSDGCIYVVQY